MEKKTNENQNQKPNKEYYTVDVLHILKMLKRRAWIVALSGLVAAIIGFLISTFIIAPTYSSHVMLYVNNSFSLDKITMSMSDISASQSLVKTYTEILKSRTTLEKILDNEEYIKKNGLDGKYTYKDLQGMISASSVNGTEIMRVTVTARDPDDACFIANAIKDELPNIISDVITNAQMKVVDEAIPIYQKVAPSRTNYTAIGMAVGLMISIALIVVMAILDDTIHTEEYIIQNYDYPILARIPNLLGSENKRYGYYYRYKSRSKDKTKDK